MKKKEVRGLVLLPSCQRLQSLHGLNKHKTTFSLHILEIRCHPKITIELVLSWMIQIDHNLVDQSFKITGPAFKCLSHIYNHSRSCYLELRVLIW